MPGLFQPNLFQNPLLFQVSSAPRGTFRALADIYLPDGNYIEAGTTFLGPSGWIPAVAVDPVDSAAIQAYWDLGPVMMKDAEIGRPLFGNYLDRRSQVFVGAPAIYWVPAPGGFILTGAGASLGVRN